MLLRLLGGRGGLVAFGKFEGGTGVAVPELFEESEGLLGTDGGGWSASCV